MWVMLAKVICPSFCTRGARDVNLGEYENDLAIRKITSKGRREVQKRTARVKKNKEDL
jgi:hypothetical protein